MANIDFPIFTIPGKWVTAGLASNVLYTQVLHRAEVNQNVIIGKAGERDAAISFGLDALIAADIEDDYKSLSYPSVFGTAKANTSVKNGGLIFTAVLAGTAGEVVTINAVTAATAVLSASVSANAITVTISDTASNNTANAFITAYNASTAAVALATISLDPMKRADGTSRNDGTGLVAAFTAITLAQSNTLQEFGHIRYLYANISTERG